MTIDDQQRLPHSVPVLQHVGVAERLDHLRHALCVGILVLAELLAAIAEANLNDVEVMRAPAPGDPVVYGIG